MPTPAQLAVGGALVGGALVAAAAAGARLMAHHVLHVADTVGQRGGQPAGASRRGRIVTRVLPGAEAAMGAGAAAYTLHRLGVYGAKLSAQHRGVLAAMGLMENPRHAALFEHRFLLAEFLLTPDPVPVRHTPVAAGRGMGAATALAAGAGAADAAAAGAGAAAGADSPPVVYLLAELENTGNVNVVLGLTADAVFAAANGRRLAEYHAQQDEDRRRAAAVQALRQRFSPQRRPSGMGEPGSAASGSSEGGGAGVGTLGSRRASHAGAALAGGSSSSSAGGGSGQAAALLASAGPCRPPDEPQPTPDLMTVLADGAVATWERLQRFVPLHVAERLAGISSGQSPARSGAASAGRSGGGWWNASAPGSLSAPGAAVAAASATNVVGAPLLHDPEPEEAAALEAAAQRLADADDDGSAGDAAGEAGGPPPAVFNASLGIHEGYWGLLHVRKLYVLQAGLHGDAQAAVQDVAGAVAGGSPVATPAALATPAGGSWLRADSGSSSWADAGSARSAGGAAGGAGEAHNPARAPSAGGGAAMEEETADTDPDPDDAAGSAASGGAGGAGSAGDAGGGPARVTPADLLATLQQLEAGAALCHYSLLDHNCRHFCRDVCLHLSTRFGVRLPPPEL